jgi:uncharacterized DUF497 family protein
VEFEWDEDKRQANWNKHRVDFEYAVLMFAGGTVSRVDDRRDYGEERWISLGRIDDSVFVVVHTEREGVRRVISAWRGGRSEREVYDACFPRDPAGS